jgi:hypothetical protein
MLHCYVILAIVRTRIFGWKWRKLLTKSTNATIKQKNLASCPWECFSTSASTTSFFKSQAFSIMLSSINVIKEPTNPMVLNRLKGYLDSSVDNDLKKEFDLFYNL